MPPPRSTDTVTSKVTVPSNATIVVGGIKSSNISDTIRKIPLLGDIPGLGILFQDRGKLQTDSVLYIFITPKIMTDPAFRDLRLATAGPQAEMEVEIDGLPDLEPVLIRPAGVRPRALESLRSPAREEDDTTSENGDTAGEEAGDPS